MLHSQVLRRVRRFQAASHTVAGLLLVLVALRQEQTAGALGWTAGTAAVLLLGLAGWERLQPGTQPVSAEVFAELLGAGVLVAAGRLSFRSAAALLGAVYLVAAVLLVVALVLHRVRHRVRHLAAAEKAAAG